MNVKNHNSRAQNSITLTKKSPLKSSIIQTKSQILSSNQLYNNQDELFLLEQQKANLQKRLSQLQQDFEVEQALKSKLESDVLFARTHLNKKFSKSQIGAILQNHLGESQNKLEECHERYLRNLDKLQQLRSEIQNLQDLNQNQEEQNNEKSLPLSLSPDERRQLHDFDTVSETLREKINSKLDQGISSPKAENIILETNRMEQQLFEVIDNVGYPSLEAMFIDSWKLDEQMDTLESELHYQLELQKTLESERNALKKQKEEKDRQFAERDSKGFEEISMVIDEIQEVQKQLKELMIVRDNKEVELNEVYSLINSLFNILDCPWDPAIFGDVKPTQVDSSNVIYAINAIETVIADSLGIPLDID